MHSCCFFDVNTLVFVSKSRCVRGSVAGAEVSVRLSLCAVHRPFLFDGLYFLLLIRCFLLEFFFQPFQFIVEVVETLDLQVIADTVAVGRDSLVIGNSVEVEEFL